MLHGCWKKRLKVVNADIGEGQCHASTANAEEACSPSASGYVSHKHKHNLDASKFTSGDQSLPILLKDNHI